MSKEPLKYVIKAIQRLYPVELADRSWDNVGLLVDSSLNTLTQQKKFKILLTVDLTRSVCKEAISKNINLILAYHPFIFRGLKQLGLDTDPQQVSLIETIKNDISVYCPHTSVDAVKGGVNDWLVNTLVKGEKNQIKVANTIIPSDDKDNGMGRFVELDKPTELNKIIQNIKVELGVSHIQLAKAENFGNKQSPNLIKTIAICAGSGGEIFGKYLKNSDNLPDLIYTGELSHHEILAFKERGSNVIVCNHSNTERGYLKIMKQNLIDELNNNNSYEVEISETDKDPLVVV